MRTRRTMSRWAVARRLQDMALRISAGKPIRIGGVAVSVPDQVVLEEELEKKGGETECEFELTWPVPPMRGGRRKRS